MADKIRYKIGRIRSWVFQKGGGTNEPIKN